MRVAVDDRGRIAHLEALESGPEVVFPEPYREPGGRPVSEPPDNKGGGALTLEAMERILERMRQRRQAR